MATTYHTMIREHQSVVPVPLALGDGIQDAAPEIQALIDAMPAGSILAFPRGTFTLMDPLQITKGMIVRGAGAESIGDIEGGTNAGTRINVGQAGNTAFVVNTRGKVHFEHLTIANPQGLGTTTGISATGPDASLNGALFTSLFHVSMWALGVGLHVTKGLFTGVDACMFWNTTNMAVSLANATTSDMGDSRIVNSTFNGSGVAINLAQGGLYVANNKFLGYVTQLACNLDAFNASTGDLLVVGNSMENYTGNGILLNRTITPHTFAFVSITGNEIFSSVAASNCINLDTNAAASFEGGTITGNCLSAMGTAIALNGGKDFVIAGNEFRAGTTTTNGIAIDSDASNCQVGLNVFAGFTAVPIINGSPSTLMTLPCPLPFSQLTAMANGSLIYCTNGTVANPVASGGTGCMAKRINGVWVGN